MTDTAALGEVTFWNRRTQAMRDSLSAIHAEAERLAYAAGALQFAPARETAEEVTGRILDLHGRLQKLDMLALAALSADSHAVHDRQHDANPARYPVHEPAEPTAAPA